MTLRLNSRRTWMLCIAGIMALGLLSRMVHTGLVIVDKYLGDALYAMMVYGLLRLFLRAAQAGVWAAVLMTAIELFQLTMIPAHLLASRHWVVRMCARLMGVQFSYLDLLAYAAGIGLLYAVDRGFSSAPGRAR